MGYQYIALGNVESIDYDLIISMLKQAYGARICYDKTNPCYRVLFQTTEQVSTIDFFKALEEDMMINIKVYESEVFMDLIDLENDYKVIEGIINTDLENDFYDKKTLLYEMIKNKELNIPLDFCIGKYATNSEMIMIIKNYFENNQNTLSTANRLYMHRNTLIKKLDKFELETGFDLRKFKDAFIIQYYLLKN